MRPQTGSENPRVIASIPFVEQLARRVAATMPHSIDIGDLVQDGVIGLIDAAHRFDEARGIKFETFAERRIRGAMIDALRKDAWPRGVRRQRRELEAAREELRRELGHEPSLADLAAKGRVRRESASVAPSFASTRSNRPPRWPTTNTSTNRRLPPGPDSFRARTARRRLRAPEKPRIACAPPLRRCRRASRR